MLPNQQTLKTKTKSPESGSSVVFKTICENPGCGHTFELKIMPSHMGALAGGVSCPRCRRPGGSLKSCGRLAAGIFAAKLVFRRQRRADSSENVSREDSD